MLSTCVWLRRIFSYKLVPDVSFCCNFQSIVTSFFHGGAGACFQAFDRSHGPGSAASNKHNKLCFEFFDNNKNESTDHRGDSSNRLITSSSPGLLARALLSCAVVSKARRMACAHAHTLNSCNKQLLSFYIWFDLSHIASSLFNCCLVCRSRMHCLPIPEITRTANH